MANNKTRTVTLDQVLKDVVRENHVERSLLRSRRKIIALIIIALVLVVVAKLAFRFMADEPMVYSNIESHFKYGSIGSEPGGSLLSPVGGLLPPLQVFKVLPAMFPDLLPGGYASLGFIFEAGHDLPIGISQRKRLGFEQVGLNCAVCHSGTYRQSPAAKPQILLGMPAHSLDLQAFFSFIFNAVLSPRFTADNVIGHIEQADGPLGWFDRLLYRYLLLPQVQVQVLANKAKIDRILSQAPKWGLGRVDTFNPYKALQFNWDLSQFDLDELTGASDYPSLWWQKPRLDAKMHLHWDGNNASLAERNLSASLGTGVTPVTIDHQQLERIASWALRLKPPAYPFPINQALAKQGQPLYRQHCIACHGDHRFSYDGQKVVAAYYLGKVTPIEVIKTDPYRLNSYTAIFAANQYTLYPDSQYSFKKFRKTNGYANQPLDGIWARAPYLHNGSVPFMRDLLNDPKQRPKVFYRGYDVYDPVKMGFISNLASSDQRQFFKYETSVKGNANSGHEYGLYLSDHEKDAIVEYMKKF